MKKPKSYHSLKVGYRSVPYEEHRTRKYKTVPQISISGEWLKGCGFNTSDKVDVFVSNGMIVLKKAEETQD